MSDQTAGVPPTAPESGSQGAPEQGNGLYDLSSVPEHLRGTVEPIFKEWDANVTRKFQEHSAYRKQWEPYENLQLQDVPRDELQELLEFRQIAQDPEAFRDWYREMGQHVLGDEDQDDLGDDPYGAGANNGGNVEKIVNDALQKALAPIMQEREEVRREQGMQQSLQAINAEMEALEQQHGKFNHSRVAQLALAYGDDPEGIQKAHADYLDLVNEARRDFVDSRLGAPTVPNQGGSPVSQVQAPTSFKEAGEAALALLRNSA